VQRTKGAEKNHGRFKGNNNMVQGVEKIIALSKSEENKRKARETEQGHRARTQSSL
jgi:hypothetical protein